MNGRIDERLSKYDRKTVFIDFSIHALKDKHLTEVDLDNAIETVRKGKIVEDKSDHARKTIAFRLHVGKENMTYTVIVGLHENFMRIVTIWKEGGRV